MELFRALAVLAEPPRGGGVARLAEALELGEPPDESQYTDLFIFQLYPYASVYLGVEGMLGGEARERIAGFLAALGQAPPNEPDHLSHLLALYAQFVEAEEAERDERRREGLRSARKALLWEHLLSWLPVYLDKLSEVATPFYARWGRLLARALSEEAESLGRQEALPLHLRAAGSAGVADPRAATVEEFLRSLLAPARSGLVLVRSDLSRAARALRVGMRAGERLFALKALLGQDAAGVLGWLHEESARWAERHAQHRDRLGGVADWWAARARATATLLEELSAEARQSGHP